MFAQPPSTNDFVKIAKWAIVALIALTLLNAGQNARMELRCGAACQRIVNHGQGY